MKKKTLISVVALILAFVLSLTVLTACKKNKGQNQVHEHSFSETWENDAESHVRMGTG